MKMAHRLVAVLALTLVSGCPSRRASSKESRSASLVECGRDFRVTRDAQIMLVTRARSDDFEVCVRAARDAALRCFPAGPQFRSVDVKAGDQITARAGGTTVDAACAARHGEHDLAWPVATLADPQATHVLVIERSSSTLSSPPRQVEDVLGPPVFRCDAAKRVYVVLQAGRVTTLLTGWRGGLAGGSLCVVRAGAEDRCLPVPDVAVPETAFDVLRDDEFRFVTREGTPLPARLCPAPLNHWLAEWSLDPQPYDLIDDRPPADMGFTLRFASPSAP